MAKAGKITPQVGDNVFITDADCPAVYGNVREIKDDIFIVETPGGAYDLTEDVLEVDELPF